jgi:hypothetical protein
MNHSEYLKQKVACQTKFIKRGGVVDAGLHTSIVGKRIADSETFKPVDSKLPPYVPNACCLASSGAMGSYVEPIKMTCSGLCTEVSSITSTPYIVIEGCSITTLSTIGTVQHIVGGCHCIQSTPAKYIESVETRVHREKNCC